MRTATTQHERTVLDISRKLTDVVMDFIGDCPECNRSFFACDKHGALVAAINVASDALIDVHDAIHNLEHEGSN